MRIAIVFMLKFLAQGQVAMMPSPAMQQAAIIQREQQAAILQREQYLARLRGARTPTPAQQMQQQALTRREMMARFAAAGMTGCMEGRTAQMMSKACRRVLGLQPSQQASIASRAAQGGQAYNAYNGITNQPCYNYATCAQQPGNFVQGLSEFVRSSAGVFILVASLVFVAYFIFFLVGAMYFAMLRVRRGYEAAVKIMDAFIQEQPVLSRLCALNLFSSEDAVKAGSLREAFLYAKPGTTKVGGLSPKVKSRGSKTVPACFFAEP